MTQKVVSSDKKRILFFVHYNKYDELSEHVVYLLQHIAKIYSKIVLISNSTLASNDLERLDGLYTTFIQRENIGFDFGAWKDALLHEGWDALAEYDSVTLMNDTCFGPIFDFESVYQKMQTKNVDFWGLVNHKKVENTACNENISIPEHIQSYFLCFNADVAAAACFKKFWVSVQNENDVEFVIEKYEIRLTQYLVDNGFRSAAFFDTSHRLEHGDNFSHLHPDITIANKVPLVKIKSFFENGLQSNSKIIQMIKDNSEYPLSIINKYFSYSCSPDEIINIYSKALNCNAGKSIAIQYPFFSATACVQIANVDNFKKISPLLTTLPTNCDLHVCVERPEQKNELMNFFSNKNWKGISPTVIVDDCPLGAFGGSVLFQKLNKYDVVGYFHENSFFSRDASIDSSPSIRLPLLFEKAQGVINEFYENDGLGIVVSDLPKGYKLKKMNSGVNGQGWKQAMQEMWTAISCDSPLNFHKKSVLVFPYGEMFWCRPVAFKALRNFKPDCNALRLRYKLSQAEVKQLFECLLVYVAWSESYDFRVLIDHNHDFTGFNHFLTLKKISKNNQDIIALLKKRTSKSFVQQRVLC